MDHLSQESNIDKEGQVKISKPIGHQRIQTAEGWKRQQEKKRKQHKDDSKS